PPWPPPLPSTAPFRSHNLDHLLSASCLTLARLAGLRNCCCSGLCNLSCRWRLSNGLLLQPLVCNYRRSVGHTCSSTDTNRCWLRSEEHTSELQSRATL